MKLLSLELTKLVLKLAVPAFCFVYTIAASAARSDDRPLLDLRNLSDDL
jgi:hypothetical protein